MQISFDHLPQVFSNFSMERDLQKCREVCKRWKMYVDDLNEVRDSSYKDLKVFGVKEWKEQIARQNEIRRGYNHTISLKELPFNLGNVPRLNHQLLEKIRSPISLNKVSLPRISVLIPGKIDGKVFDIKKFYEIFWGTLSISDIKQIKNCRANPTACWVIFTPHIVSNSTVYANDRKLVEKLAEESHNSYSIPNSFEMIFCTALYHKKLGAYLVQKVTCCDVENNKRRSISLKQQQSKLKFKINKHDNDYSKGVCMIEKIPL